MLSAAGSSPAALWNAQAVGALPHPDMEAAFAIGFLHRIRELSHGLVIDLG